MLLILTSILLAQAQFVQDSTNVPTVAVPGWSVSHDGQTSPTTFDTLSSDIGSSFSPTQAVCGDNRCEPGEMLLCPQDCIDEVLDGMCDCVVSAGLCDATCEKIFEVGTTQCDMYAMAGICGQILDTTVVYRDVCPTCQTQTSIPESCYEPYQSSKDMNQAAQVSDLPEPKDCEKCQCTSAFVGSKKLLTGQPREECQRECDSLDWCKFVMHKKVGGVVTQADCWLLENDSCDIVNIDYLPDTDTSINMFAGNFYTVDQKSTSCNDGTLETGSAATSPPLTPTDFTAPLPSFSTATPRPSTGDATSLSTTAVPLTSPDVCISLTLQTGSRAQDIAYSLLSTSCSGSGFTDFGFFSQTCCLPEGRYTISCADASFGEGWQQALFFIDDKRLCEDFNTGADMNAVEVFIKDGETVFIVPSDDSVEMSMDDMNYDDSTMDDSVETETSMDDYTVNDEYAPEVECPEGSHKADDGLCYCDSNHMLATDTVFGCEKPTSTEIDTLSTESPIEVDGYVESSTEDVIDSTFDMLDDDFKSTEETIDDVDGMLSTEMSTENDGDADFSMDDYTVDLIDSTFDNPTQGVDSTFEPLTSDIFSSDIASTSEASQAFCGNSVCEADEQVTCPMDCPDEIIDGMCECVVAAGMCDATCDVIFQIGSDKCNAYGASGICGQLIDSKTLYRNICPACWMEATPSDTLSTESSIEVDGYVESSTEDVIDSTFDIFDDKSTKETIDYVDDMLSTEMPTENDGDADFSMDDYTVDLIDSTFDTLDDFKSTEETIYVDDASPTSTVDMYDDETFQSTDDASYVDDEETSMGDFGDEYEEELECAPGAHKATNGLCYCDSNHMLVTDPVFGCDQTTEIDTVSTEVDLTTTDEISTMEPTMESSNVETNAPTPTTTTRTPEKPEVSVDLSFQGLTRANFNSKKRAIKSTLSSVTGVPMKDISLILLDSSKRNRRGLQSSSTVRAVFKTQEPTLVKETIRKEQIEAFTEQSEELQDLTLLAVSEATITIPSTTTTQGPTLPARTDQLENSQTQSGQAWPILELAILGICFLAFVALLFVLRSIYTQRNSEFKVMETLWREEKVPAQTADFDLEGNATPYGKNRVEAEGETTTQPKRFMQAV